MYRQILIDDEDKKYQLVVWREDPTKLLRYYKLCTVTYGTTTAPYLATRYLQELATQDAAQYPSAARALTEDFYVDDMMTGANTVAKALIIQTELNNVLKDGGFKLRKWCSNCPELLSHIPAEDRAIQLDLDDLDDHSVKALGLTWLPKSDDFQIRTHWEPSSKVTKRKVISDIAHLFDPLGLLCPVVTRAKIFLQQMWTLKLDWDAAVPIEMHTAWLQYRDDLKVLNDIRIPRHIYSGEVAQTSELHAFSDASEKVYGAALYIRSKLQDGTIIVRLLCAKSKVAPIKTITLPRLELCAAKLSSQLVFRVKQDLKWDQPCYFWTDSEIVLAWNKSSPSRYHTFVANRIAAIQEVTLPSHWRYVQSKQNPADLTSRGVSAKVLKECTTWFYGPIFLHAPESSWSFKPTISETNLEVKQAKIILAATLEPSYLTSSINHRNSFGCLQRVIAYALRFVHNCRQQKKLHSGLTVKELENSLTIIIKEAQEQGFGDELKQLKRTGNVSANSKLNTFAPFLDSNGIIRVGGRLEQASISYDAKHPMLLPYAYDVTRLLMVHTHITYCHVGAQNLLAHMRQRFWPIKGKDAARLVVNHCVRCHKSKPKLLNQLMAPLPLERVQPARPFLNAGVDFCGPFWIHYKIRGKRPQKAYVAIFCCFSTKAVHIEVVSDLTTDAFIGALKRFVSRRGNCRTLHCDNATNFVGAKNQLHELKDAIYHSKAEEKISRICASKNIDFRFIPPRAPHFGGLWEAAVKSAKYLLQRKVGPAELTYEELETVMTEIEAILNSRPLTPLSSDPNDLSALTPGHFLIGEPLTSKTDPTTTSQKGGLLQRWKLVNHLKIEFWNRWTKEYLSELQHRYKWKQEHVSIKPETMVIVKEDNVPVLKWPLGRVVKTIEGKDGLVRMADVRTVSGVFRRPIHNLAPLPIANQNEDSPTTNASPIGNSAEARESSRRVRSAEDNEGPLESAKRHRAASNI